MTLPCLGAATFSQSHFVHTSCIAVSPFPKLLQQPLCLPPVVNGYALARAWSWKHKESSAVLPALSPSIHFFALNLGSLEWTGQQIDV